MLLSLMIKPCPTFVSTRVPGLLELLARGVASQNMRVRLESLRMVKGLSRQVSHNKDATRPRFEQVVSTL